MFPKPRTFRFAGGVALGATAVVGSATLLGPTRAVDARALAAAPTTKPTAQTPQPPATPATPTPEPPAPTATPPQRPAAVPETKPPAQLPRPRPAAQPPAQTSGASGQGTAAVVAFARQQIGDSYSWGGNGPDAWDCSGLATAAWRKAGVQLPRTTTAIYSAVGRKVAYGDLQPGDLLFFYSGRSHVGVYAGQGQMIHAPSSGKHVQQVDLGSHYKQEFNGAVRPG
ncbi:hypothetical protein DPM19_29760 [Actinomadura craniellae]|uniref:NlpC/P60 domain-containing protein n=1 Tax=Actinomadura craniellae TaxID=2231787 RepID=A0A365GXD1_9ACTN|nr:NlpC/P60 family protein [Actinomadura craniellae]RAY11494.1 hypothetical protein DPM19_29760 [Actinomadura craniellae]